MTAPDTSLSTARIDSHLVYIAVGSESYDVYARQHSPGRVSQLGRVGRWDNGWLAEGFDGRDAKAPTRCDAAVQLWPGDAEMNRERVNRELTEGRHLHG